MLLMLMFFCVQGQCVANIFTSDRSILCLFIYFANVALICTHTDVTKLPCHNVSQELPYFMNIGWKHFLQTIVKYIFFSPSFIK